MLRIVTNNLAATHKLGEAIGKNLKGDETLALVAPLGGGKTSFTQELAKGLGIKKLVISPTFVLERTYKGRHPLHHFDMYRIEVEDADSTGLSDILGEAVVVVEWAEKLKSVLPEDTIWATIKIVGENTREFIFEYPESRSYVFQNVK
ncbi:TPA: tRNA (adenosine(37)-N6)-threonylcarbamoyltransferase complex ATPase subunit type 1 TsaE [Patescibacteria group bacterium]|uniref:tRNA threonylcarbamoyladenosine biosynthesis protein TsaE n=2 Tax=Bacteria division Kazan-3B-28 TaxID=1798534 RepID=A0A0G1X833_UNCK3|nr:MAG: hypothetical protein VE98_C0001G0462 [candidate division Kazan bacterium GW2011_GWA1_50_15]KKW25850.1 MAG: Nucleotide-binding protein [candidate division Kazan bacterium GW2011_GWC1_52_13]KKW27136.1 MAG: Nucleotide-binding protein [candidate division Kazan bacterium GW2011_GWB1_52_7]HCL47430.1 tRNA (adenosine(37)-N6)-threonylcarbamoyltransferase complex ATPase subunit type 1 TsaE [Patescibacteria group bacterium]HCR42424.1 tRNA (adenosine(37)-N6)-threonylcarbamoyltransferase complex ATP